MAMETAILERITAALQPADVKVAVVDAASGKYAVRVVAAAFDGKPLLARHRLVNAAVGMQDPETAARVHALEIEALAPGEE